MMTPTPPTGIYSGAEWKLLKKGRSALQPNTWLVTPTEEGADPLVLKEFTERAWIIRKLWAPWIVWREQRALECAARLKTGFTPRPIPTPISGVLAMEYVAGTPLPKELPQEWSEEKGEKFFKDFARGVAALHDVGLSHGDIRRTNIFVGQGGEPHLLDFASATPRRPFFKAPLSRIFHEVQRRVDVMTLEKIRRRTLYGKEGSTDHYPWFMKLGRIWKKGIYGTYKKQRERKHGAPRRDLEGQ